MVIRMASLSLVFWTLDKSSSILFVAAGIRSEKLFSSLSMSDIGSFGIADLLREKGLDIRFEDRCDFLKPMRRFALVHDLACPETADRRVELLPQFFEGQAIGMKFSVEKISIEFSAGVWFSVH